MKLASTYTLSSPRPAGPVLVRLELHADSPDPDAAASAHRELGEHIERLCERGGRFGMVERSGVIQVQESVKCGWHDVDDFYRDDEPKVGEGENGCKATTASGSSARSIQTTV